MTQPVPRHQKMVLENDFPFQIPGWPNYGVTLDGRVRRLDSGKWLSPCASKRGGYLQVSLWHAGKGRLKYVHQLVALTFHGPKPSPKHDVAHHDGDKRNNHYSNLRWATRAENEADKVRHGRSNRGERNGAAKLTDAQSAELRSRAASLPRSSGGVKLRKGVLQKLAAEYGITPSGVWQIINDYRRAAQ